MHIRLVVGLTISLALTYLAFSAPATASLIGTRAAVEQALGGNATLETFENLPIADHASGGSLLSLDSTTTIGSGGTGFVVPGVRFESFGGMSFVGRFFGGIPSKSLVGDPHELTLIFSTPVTHVGVDFRNFAGEGEVAMVLIFGDDNASLIATLTGIDLQGTDPVFFGFAADEGIGKIVFGASGYHGPVIDDLMFGRVAPEPSAIPEPSTAVLVSTTLLLGLGFASASRNRIWRKRHLDAQI